MSRDIESTNSKGEFHGYNEWYYDKSPILSFRCNYKNGKRDGYLENYTLYGIRDLVFNII